jgi:hypothetical protein
MPLQSGSTRDIISNNISEMVASGHPQDQAVAAALHNADKHAKKVAHGHAARVKKAPKMGTPLKHPNLHPMHPFNSAKAPAPFKAKAAKPLPAPQTMDTRAVVAKAAQSIVPGSRVPVVSGGYFSK